MEEKLGRPLEPYNVHILYGKQEQVRSDSNAECGLNGELFPNENTVPIIK